MPDPRVSVILATDTYGTIRPVIERVRRRTVRQQLELVMVAPSAEAVGPVLAYRDEFAAIRIVENPVTVLAAARTAGIRSATAPIVFVGETHSYPHPKMFETILARFEGPWAAVTPAFENGNPDSTISWACFVADYGKWTDVFPAGEIPQPPFYNAAFYRSLLVGLGDKLQAALEHGNELFVAMQARGLRTYFEPAARIEHLNVTRPRDWLRQRYVSGLHISAHRAAHWPLARRLIYVAGSGLIPLVLFWRTLPGLRRMARTGRLPAATLPLMLAGLMVKACGELMGYAGRSAAKADAVNDEYEIHKELYASGAEA